MAATDYWSRLRGEGAEAALHEMVQEYGDRNDPSPVMALGVAYLWRGHYKRAFEHFDDAIKTSRTSKSVFFGMAGVAKWCVDDPKEAVGQWRAGLRAQYADGAGGIRLPMLLFTAAVVTPSAFSQAEAAFLLNEKVHDARARNWPGPLGKFLLGQIDQEGLLEHLTGVHQNDTALRHWLSDFYKGVVGFSCGEVSVFNGAMRKAVEVAVNESNDQRFFTGCIWHEEFFIARHEVSSA